MIKQQKGVALVQVLLITSMILILVVQLSKGAREQIKTSQVTKDKSLALLKMKTVLEKTKFDMLSIDYLDGRAFFNQEIKTNGLVVRIQDESGLISLSYGVDQLAQYLRLEATSEKIVNLMTWQGLETANQTNNIDGRNGLMQFSKELFFIPGWEDYPNIGSDITYFPTPFFNPVSAPLNVLEKLYGQEVTSELENLRQAGNIAAAQSLLRAEDVGVSTEPSNVFRIRVEQSVFNSTIVRSEKVQFNLDSQLVVQSVGF